MSTPMRRVSARGAEQRDELASLMKKLF